jgi:prepilin-type processing-associated H-X9-DG protein
MEDHFTQGNVDEETFELIIEVGRTLYQRHAKRRKETLTIVGNWNNSTVNAYMSRHNGKVNITMFGGLARRPEINAEGFALVLCHELSHAYGGAPYIYKEERISAEGQADYAGARVCMRRMASALDFPFRYDTYITRICAGDFLCEVSLSAGQSTANLLARLSTEGTPSYQTPDRTRVTKTNLSYPKTVQCRLDSYFNGTMNKPRPRCWYYN